MFNTFHFVLLLLRLPEVAGLSVDMQLSPVAAGLRYMPVTESSKGLRKGRKATAEVGSTSHSRVQRSRACIASCRWVSLRLSAQPTRYPRTLDPYMQTLEGILETNPFYVMFYITIIHFMDNITIK